MGERYGSAVTEEGQACGHTLRWRAGVRPCRLQPGEHGYLQGSGPVGTPSVAICSCLQSVRLSAGPVSTQLPATSPRECPLFSRTPSRCHAAGRAMDTCARDFSSSRNLHTLYDHCALLSWGRSTYGSLPWKPHTLLMLHVCTAGLRDAR